MKQKNRKSNMTPNELVTMRKQKGYSQASLAAAIGYSRTQLGNFERGEYPIPKIVALVLKLIEPDTEIRHDGRFKKHAFDCKA